MSTASYDQLTKEQLVELLLERDRDTESNPHRKKYGLIWEEKPEQFEADSIGRIPVLQRDAGKCIFTSPDRPTHVLIQGDNYHALKVLTYTHERSVDVIYIDPPYNTGNKDFKYNDKFVDREDGYRHSKWLSFMAKRLRLAKALLKDAGAIFLSIDANEHAQLKLLCDEIFGEQNIIADMVWHNSSRTNDFIAVEHEYILVYAKTVGPHAPWKTPRIEAAQLSALVRAQRDSGATKAEAEAALRKEIAAIQKSAADPRSAKWLDNYRTLDDDWRIYYPVDLSGEGSGPPRVFDGVSVPAPAGRHWMGQEYIDELLSSGRIVWRGDRAYRKLFIDESMDGLKSIVSTPGRQGTATLKEVLGRDMFNNPKPVDLLHKLLRYYPNKDAVVLDFFAGSGSTAHAVMQLNAEDGGHRQCILVTNDEGEFKNDAGDVLLGGICTHVTYPRLKKVIEGYTTPKGKQVTGLGENLTFYSTDFVEDRALERYRRELSSRSAEMLCLRESCYQEEAKTDKSWRSFTDGKGKRLVVVSDEFAASDLVPLLKADKRETVVYVFCFGDDEDPANEYSGEGLEHVTAKPVPDSLLALHRRIQKQEVKAV